MVVGGDAGRQRVAAIGFVVPVGVERQARFLRRRLIDVAEADADHREGQRRQFEQVDHPLRVLADAADRDDA